MTTDLIKPLLFFLILGLFACSNKAPNQEEELSKSAEGTPVLVANDKKEDTLSIPIISDQKPETSLKETPGSKQTPPKEINKKPKVQVAKTEVSKKRQEVTTIEKPADKTESINKEDTSSLEKESTPNQAETSPVSPKETVELKATGASHEAWDALLKKYVSADGKVNYKGFKTSERELDAYLDHLAKNPIKSDWSRAEQMVYWINAYNAFTIKLIVDNYPVGSITNLHGGKPWDVKWIKLGDQTYSLNNIENDILRPKFKDARIHFAVNCAAQSCPPLLNRAWRSGSLNSTFDQQAKKFINNPKFNKISANAVQISKIFEWYASDFGNIVDYLNKYSNTKINANAKVTYLEYDWALNN